MPNLKSAAKRHRQSLRSRDRNRSTKSALKTELRKTRESIAGGDLTKSQELFRTTAKKLDQVASKGIIHRNKAARLKSRLSARLKKIKQAGAAS